MLARDIMETRFHTLRPEETVAQAVKMFQTASRVEGKKHGEKTDAPAAVFMRHPVLGCAADEFLSQALKQMLLKDVQRLFVYQDDPGHIVGVLSLSDSARFRSGSCRACTSGRLIVGG